MKKIWDFCFELTEESDNEGEVIFCENDTLEHAWNGLLDAGFERDELRYVGKYTPEEAEILDYDTY